MASSSFIIIHHYASLCIMRIQNFLFGGIKTFWVWWMGQVARRCWARIRNLFRIWLFSHWLGLHSSVSQKAALRSHLFLARTLWSLVLNFNKLLSRSKATWCCCELQRSTKKGRGRSSQLLLSLPDHDRVSLQLTNSTKQGTLATYASSQMEDLGWGSYKVEIPLGLAHVRTYLGLAASH